MRGKIIILAALEAGTGQKPRWNISCQGEKGKWGGGPLILAGRAFGLMFRDGSAMRGRGVLAREKRPKGIPRTGEENWFVKIKTVHGRGAGRAAGQGELASRKKSRGTGLSVQALKGEMTGKRGGGEEGGERV